MSPTAVSVVAGSTDQTGAVLGRGSDGPGE